ncbi:MAG: potassium transporter KefB [Bacteroidetes bacterium]|nr:potassium transporter KefB [Bacteroidota bacterium]
MELPILSDIVIILGLSVFIILLFQRLRLPAILGFLITGIIVGPHGLNLIKAVHEVELLSEIGIIFLLFVIGIEFSLRGLNSIKNTVLFGGMLQVGGTIGLVTLISWLLGMPLRSAIFLGFLLSLSSTAIVLKMLQEKGELTSPHGRVSIAILIFQDIIVVLMMLLTPILAGKAEDPVMELFWLSVKVIGIIITIFILARYLVPLLFKWVVKSKSSELFILTVVVLCFATAWLTSSIGLSLALGAFFAGLIISESDYNHQATAKILPFREIFISFFFVSVGMLLDFSFFIENILFIHLATLGVIVLKMLIIALSVLLLRYPSRTVFLTALSIFQVGEFAFLLLAVGMQYELLTGEVYQFFLAISIISMGATPFLINYSPRITNFLIRLSLPAPVKIRLRALTLKREEKSKSEEKAYHDHLVIIGYGMNGENVAKAARKANISYVIIELDPDALKNAKANGEPVVYGDATNELILKHVHVHEARVIVVAISAHDATMKIVQTIRAFTETAFVIVRTRYLREVEELIKLGADEVIPEEFETSIVIFSHVLKKYLVPGNDIAGFVSEIRNRNYEMLRGISGMQGEMGLSKIKIPDVEIATLPVKQGKNLIVGKTIKASGIRSNYGVTVLAVKRGEKYLTNVSPELKICQDDVLYVFGTPESIIKLNSFFISDQNPL